MSLLRRLGRMLSGEPAPTAAPPAVTTNTPRPAPPVPRAAPAFDFSDERIPTNARGKIEQILASITEVEQAIKREPIPSFSRADTDQMRDLHLPKLVQSYIAIPPAHRSEIFRKTGKSASVLLCESLDQMQERIDGILRDLAQHDIDAFTNNMQFINDRYSKDDNPFG